MAGCNDDLNDVQNQLSDFTAPGAASGAGTGSAANSLATYGYCVGTNALTSAITNLPIVKEIESDIAEGELQAVAVVTMVTGSLALFSAIAPAAGAVIAGITSVMPIVGVCVVVVVAAVEFFDHIGPGPQLWVPNPNANTDGILHCPSAIDPITGKPYDMVFEKINLSDYGGFIKNAMNWLNVPANAQTALTMTPEQFSAMHNIFIDSSQPGLMVSDVYGCNGGGFGNDTTTFQKVVAANQSYQTLADQTPPPPGAYELLRTVQLPAAAAAVAALPTYANYLTNNDGALGGGNNANAPLMTTFPALRTTDMAAVFAAQPTTASNSWSVVIVEAREWTLQQCPPPAPEDIMSRYNLPRSDACTLLSNWVPPNGCATQTAPPCHATIVTPIVTTSSLGTGTAVPETSTATKVVATVAAVGAGALLYHTVIAGYTVASTGRAIVKDTKRAGHWIGQKLHFGRRANPIQLERKSATGGRAVVHRIDLESRYDRVELVSANRAVIYRYDKPVARFKPSKFQKTKIRAGMGEVLVFADQLE